MLVIATVAHTVVDSVFTVSPCLDQTLARASEVAARSRKKRTPVSSSDFFTQPGLGDVNMTMTSLPANRKIDQCGDDIVMFGVDQEFSE